MLTIDDIFSPIQVRFLLTVSEADLPDEVLMQYGLEDELGARLDKKLPTWATLTDSGHVRSLRMYARYYCVSVVARLAPVFVLKKMTDGANEGQRMDKEGLRWLADELAGRADEILNDLLEDLDIDVPAEGVQLVGRVVPLRDPITDPREE